jgi:LemA protein
MPIIGIIIIILAVFIIYFIFAYNGFVRAKNRVLEAWADIDVQLKRRYDLIPNLMETVKGYMEHERETLESVTAARTNALAQRQGGDTAADSAAAENQITDALKTLFAVAENYPDLKANENFIELQRELADTENKIQASRRFYNSTVREFNTQVESFPSNAIAQIFKFGQFELYGLDETPEQRENIKVKF